MHCYAKQVIIRNGEKKVDVSMKKSKNGKTREGFAVSVPIPSHPYGGLLEMNQMKKEFN